MNYISISIFILCVIHTSSITIWICLTEIYKVTIACFKPTIFVGSIFTHVRFITWTTQCTCWLVVRSCEIMCVPWYWAPSFWIHYQGLFELWIVEITISHNEPASALGRPSNKPYASKGWSHGDCWYEASYGHLVNLSQANSRGYGDERIKT